MLLSCRSFAFDSNNHASISIHLDSFFIGQMLYLTPNQPIYIAKFLPHKSLNIKHGLKHCDKKADLK